MLKNILLLLSGAILGAVALFALHLRPAPVPKVEATADLEAAYAQFTNAIKDSGTFVQNHQWYGSDRERAEAYRHIARASVNALTYGVLIDPDFPFFAEIGPFTKGGMDNSDQLYLATMINGDGVYRIWGTRGGSKRLDFSVYEQDPLSETLAVLDSQNLQVNKDGSFTLVLGGPPREGNWLPLEPGIKRLLVRQIYSNWENELPGAMHIDRIDDGRPLYPQFDSNLMAERLIDAANQLSLNVRRWPEFSRTRFDALMPANSLTPPQNVGDTGGLEGRVMVGGHFQLTSDEALLIKAWPTQANYQGIQLGHHWWESLDYANRQSSLTTEQASVSSDGAIYYVISERDPGVANWLDTEGFQRGVIFMRYDGIPSAKLQDDEVPTARVVSLDSLLAEMPDDEPQVSAQQRKVQIAQRRRQVQRRFGL